MILTVDIGNTNIKVGAWDNDNLSFVSRIATNIIRTEDEYAIQLLEIFSLNGCNRSQFDGAIIASVVPPLSATMANAISRVIQTNRVYQVGPGVKTGLNIKIDNPAQLGADMVCAAVSAVAKYSLPCIIASFGTATAIFALNESGDFLGGAVASGMIVSLEALSNRTAQLPHISFEVPQSLIGTNTEDCMKSGLIHGNAAMLDGMILRFKEQLGAGATVVACGGMARFVVPHCREKITYDDNMVMDGLRIIYYKNAK